MVKCDAIHDTVTDMHHAHARQDKIEGQQVRTSSMVRLISLCILSSKFILGNKITPHTAQDTVPPTLRSTQQSHLRLYLPNSSPIGNPDTVAWLRAARCTATGRHRASRAAIACTACLQPTPPFRATHSKGLLVLSSRGAAGALVAARRDQDPSPPICARLTR